MLASQNHFDKLIARLSVDNKFEKAIEQGLQRYQIKQYKIQNLGPSQVFLLYNLLSSKFYFNKSPSNLESWYENELRLFVWLVVGFVFVEQKCITHLTLQDWQYFSNIFNNRNPEQLQFQALSILKKQNKFSKWADEEITLLDKIIKSKNIKNKWNQIARELFLKSDKKYFRTSKQCRQYWINHLDPTPVKSEWRAEQDLQLVIAIKELGKKWAKVSKALGGRRTEHMVKNRFKSLYQIQSKKMKVEFQQQFTQHQVINEMKTRLKKRVQQEKLYSYEPTTQDIQYEKIREQAQKIQSAEGEVIQLQENFSENNLLAPFFEIQEKLDSQDNIYEKLPLICQTLGTIDDNDEREIRLGPKIQTIFNDELNSFFGEIDFT